MSYSGDQGSFVTVANLQDVHLATACDEFHHSSWGFRGCSADVVDCFSEISVKAPLIAFCEPPRIRLTRDSLCKNLHDE